MLGLKLIYVSKRGYWYVSWTWRHYLFDCHFQVSGPVNFTKMTSILQTVTWKPFYWHIFATNRLYTMLGRFPIDKSSLLYLDIYIYYFIQMNEYRLSKSTIHNVVQKIWYVQKNHWFGYHCGSCVILIQSFDIMHIYSRSSLFEHWYVIFVWDIELILLNLVWLDTVR